MSIVAFEASGVGSGALVVILTPSEAAELRDCEAKIRRGLESFVSMGNALARIRDRRLYREKYGTFEDYCQAEWDLSARRARQLWAAAEVVSELLEKNFTALPATESQARPLTMLPPGQRAEVWREAIDTAPNGKITASHVATVVQHRIGRPKNVEDTPLPTTQDQKPPIDAGPKVDNVRAQAGRAIAEVRRLMDEMGTPGAAAAADVGVALSKLEHFQDHLARVETTWAERKKK